MSKTFIITAALFGFLAVALGAFGAHGLKNRLAPDLLDIYQTGVQYHFYHTMALLACGMLMVAGVDNGAMRVSGMAFIVGMIIFSGSLYLLSITGLRWLGAVTPVGGLALMIGWIALALGVFRGSL